MIFHHLKILIKIKKKIVKKGNKVGFREGDEKRVFWNLQSFLKEKYGKNVNTNNFGSFDEQSNKDVVDVDYKDVYGEKK